MMKKIFFAALALLSLFAFFSCDNDDEESVTDYDVSEIYGYTYYGNITASGGNTLIPSLILYDDERCDWNVSVNGMNNNQFYYYSVKNSEANYTLYWYSAENLSYCKQKDSSKASMVVQLGINSADEIVILLTGDNLTGVSGMTNTRVPMTKQTSIEKNTTPSEISYDEDVEDITITIPESAQSAEWGGETTYSGTFVFLVGESGSVAKGAGSSGTDSDGNEITPTVQITDTNSTSSATVTFTTNRFAYTESMIVEPFDITGVQVKKDGDVYYLNLDSTTITTDSLTLNEVTLDAKLENSVLTVRLSFKPGKMPFPITEIFTSGSGD